PTPGARSACTPCPPSPLPRGAWPPPAPLPRPAAPQKRSPEQQRDFSRPPLKPAQPYGQKALPTGARDAQPDRAEAGHEIPLVVAVAIDAPPPAPPFIASRPGKPVALPLRLQLEKPLPRLPSLPTQIAPQTLFHLRQKMLEMLRDRDYLRHWV